MDIDDDGDGVIDILDTRPLEPGVDPIPVENNQQKSSKSNDKGTVSIDTNIILALIVISSIVTFAIVWRAKKSKSNDEASEEPQTMEVEV